MQESMVIESLTMQGFNDEHYFQIYNAGIKTRDTKMRLSCHLGSSAE
jgi:hypothetical protein